MSKKIKLSPIATAVGVSVVAALASLPIASAASNPFTTSDLGSGYQVAAEGSCGGMKKGEKMKSDGKCGEMKGKKGAKDGSCGEGKCGGMKKGEKMKSDGKCGGKKAKEGSCGGKK